MRVAVIVGILALVVAGVSAEQKGAAGDEAAIAKVRAAYQAAVQVQDAAAIAKLYAPDGVEMPPNARAAKGRAAIEAYHKSMAQQFMVHGMTIASTDAHVMGDRAYDVGTYKQSLMPQKGGPVVDDQGKYIVLLMKDVASGNWWITHTIYNTDLPMPAPPKKN